MAVPCAAPAQLNAVAAQLCAVPAQLNALRAAAHATDPDDAAFVIWVAAVPPVMFILPTIVKVVVSQVNWFDPAPER